MSEKNLEKVLISLPSQKFTGIVTTKQKNKEWKLYFYLGKFLWVEGGYHPNLAWYRHMRQHFPNIDLEKLVWNASLLALKEDKDVEHLKYYALVTLLQEHEFKLEQIIAAIEAMTQEVFFDILQREHKQELQYDKQNYSAHQILKAGFNLSLAQIDLKRVMFESHYQWLTWKTKGLASFSPNLAPLLIKDRELENKIPKIVLDNMIRMLDGKHSLRDLAVKMDKNLLDVALGIVPYFIKGYVKFKEIPDLPEINISNLTKFEALS